MPRPEPAASTLSSRADLLQYLLDLVEPLRLRFTPGRAGIALPGIQGWYGEAIGRLEAFARPLWGLVPAALGGARLDFSPWQAGLLRGTDPTHPEYWGRHEERDQRMVETPILAIAFARLPDFWEPYTEAQRRQIAAWLSGINGAEPVDNNWHFFRILTNCALRLRGFPADERHLEEDLARIDAFYLGDGWYSDGLGRRGDYYVPMAMHFYGLLYRELVGPSDPRSAAYLARARRFASDFEPWFDAQGAAVPFGRSLTYRFAQGAFWGALAQASLEALPWARIRGHYFRHLRWWRSQPILSEAGLLTVGYAYSNPAIGENYNAPGSPYWAFKAFAPLALPESHPFWTAAEAPVEAEPVVLGLPHAGYVVAAPPNRAESVFINAGQPVSDYPRHAAHKYCKFAYSSAFGLCVPFGSRLSECGADSALLVSVDGDRYRPRERCDHARVEGAIAYSAWSPWEGIAIETWLVARPEFHLRIHRIRAHRGFHAAETGFAVGYRDLSDLERTEDGDTARVAGPRGQSVIRSLWGARTAGSIRLEPGSSLMTPLAFVPALRAELTAGEHWLACAALGTRSTASKLPALEARLDAHVLVVSGDSGVLWRSDAPFQVPSPVPSKHP